MPRPSEGSGVRADCQYSCTQKTNRGQMDKAGPRGQCNVYLRHAILSRLLLLLTSGYPLSFWSLWSLYSK